MAQSSTIEWTQATWNPVVGCRKVSSGCANCYAERMAHRLAAMARADVAAGRNPGKKAAYLHVINARGRWNGDVFLDDSAVTAPLSWRTPKFIFVNSMSDLFHEDVPLRFIQSVFDVMNACPQHTFQVLTKRPGRAREYSGKFKWTSNIWMGTSVENRAVVERVHELRGTKAQVKFLSVEPLLGPLPQLPLTGIDWVIVGGESGPGARFMDPAWVRQIRDCCIAREVLFFFKQWGGVDKSATGRELDGRTWDEMPGVAAVTS
jgi:protein gp37